jgi:hypothetical protein
MHEWHGTKHPAVILESGTRFRDERCRTRRSVHREFEFNSLRQRVRSVKFFVRGHPFQRAQAGLLRIEGPPEIGADRNIRAYEGTFFLSTGMAVDFGDTGETGFRLN